MKECKLWPMEILGLRDRCLIQMRIQVAIVVNIQGQLTNPAPKRKEVSFMKKVKTKLFNFIVGYLLLAIPLARAYNFISLN